jgi:hypothetical protein
MTELGSAGFRFVPMGDQDRILAGTAAFSR